MQPTTRLQGFTLMEILVALVIFSMLSVGAFGVLTNLRQSQVTLDERSQRLEMLQHLVGMTRHDFSQIIARPVSSDPQAPLVHIDNTGISFIACNWRNPMAEPRSTLAAMRYDLNQGVLTRQFWPFAQASLAQPSLSQILTDQVTGLRLQPIETGEMQTQKPMLPAAIEMTVTLPPFGNITQLIPMVTSP